MQWLVRPIKSRNVESAVYLSQVHTASYTVEIYCWLFSYC